MRAENIRLDIINQHEDSLQHDIAGNVIETHEHAGEFKEWSSVAICMSNHAITAYAIATL